MSATWPRAPLSPDDLDAIESVTWRAFPKSTVIAIAEGWNAGMATRQMAADLGCPFRSLCVLLGKLTEVGVKLRSARAPAMPVAGAAPAPASPRRIEIMAPDRLGRLRRVAAWDGAARRALEAYERGVQ